MELMIKEFTVTPSVEFNVEQLKTEIADTLYEYEDKVYGEEEMQDAKKDLAKLRKFYNVLDDARKDVKNQLLAPYKDFEAKLNEVKALVEKPIGLIDTQVKNYEAQVKETKATEIKTIYERIEFKKPEFDLLSKIWNPKWLNVTYKLANIEDEIRHALVEYNKDIEIVRNLGEYSAEAELEYIKTLDVSAAVKRAQELRNLSELKAKNETARTFPKHSQAETVPAEPATVENEVPKRQWIGFEALLSSAEAVKLKAFFDTNKIEFRKPVGGR